MREKEPTNVEKMESDENLLKEYSYFVRLIAHQMLKKLPPTIELTDLITAGTEGLYEAINNYDPSKNTSFKTYAEFRIRGAMLDFLRSQDMASRWMRDKEKRGEIEPQKFINLQEILASKLPKELYDNEKNDPFIYTSARERAEKIFRAIEELSPREKTVINLYYHEGLPQKKLARH